MKNNTVAASLVWGAIIIIGAIFFAGGSGTSSSGNAQEGKNVVIENGKQIITIDARGGYSPRFTTAQAGIPTVIRMNTKATFDCSSSLVIPKIGFQKFLPSSGSTDIEIPAQKSGETMQGVCGMGMYNFEIAFK